MTLVKNNQSIDYEATPVRKSRKQDIRIISEMSRTRILTHLVYRCRVGMLMSSNLILVVYVTHAYRLASVLFG